MGHSKATVTTDLLTEVAKSHPAGQPSLTDLVLSFGHDNLTISSQMTRFKSQGVSIKIGVLQAFPIKDYLSMVGWPSLVTTMSWTESQLPRGGAPTLKRTTDPTQPECPQRGLALCSASGPSSEQDNKGPALTEVIVRWGRQTNKQKANKCPPWYHLTLSIEGIGASPGVWMSGEGIVY